MWTQGEVPVSDIHFYLSLIPQGLIASMLESGAFRSYYSIGSQAQSRGVAVFFEVDRSAISPGEFLLHLADERRCLRH